LLIDSLLILHSDRLSAVNIHVNDALTPSELIDTLAGVNIFNAYFNMTGTTPAGMINRTITTAADLSPTSYPSKIETGLGAIPRCGLALDANDVMNGYLNLEVHVGFSDDMAGAYRLFIYLVQNSFSSTDSIYDQFNDFSQFGITPYPGTPLFDLPTEINNYTYTQVFRKTLNTGGTDGEEIPASVTIKGKEYIKNYIVDVRNIDLQNYSIVAFVDKYGPNGTTHRIENVREVKIGNVAVWN
jgi:hypothetical protein